MKFSFLSFGTNQGKGKNQQVKTQGHRSDAKSTNPVSDEPSNPVDAESGPSNSSATFPYIVCSETNRRDNNEDSFQLFQFSPLPYQPPLTLLAIADGMGGYDHGEQVSRQALHRLTAAVTREFLAQKVNCLIEDREVQTSSFTEILMEVLDEVNRYVQQMIENNSWRKAGSTLVLALIWKNIAVVANLGDSPAFHYVARTQKLTKITTDHTVAGALLRKGFISPEMARHHEGRSQLEFYLGAPNLPRESPIYCVDLSPNDLLLMCSDGVNGLLSEETMTEILQESSSDLAAASQRLLQAARASDETDNQTLILWRHLEPGGMPLAPQGLNSPIQTEATQPMEEAAQDTNPLLLAPEEPDQGNPSQENEV